MLTFHGEEVFLGGFLNALKEFAELRSQEAGNDGGRRFVGSQTMGIGGAHDGGLQQTVVAVDAHEGFNDEGDETQIVFWGLAWRVEEMAGVGGETPVVVLAATVDASERLLVEQATETVVAGDVAHQRHDEHIVVDSQVAFLINRSELKLVGGHFVVARLARDAQLQRLDFQVAHELNDTCLLYTSRCV